MVGSSAKPKAAEAQQYNRALNVFRRTLLAFLAAIACISIISFTTVHFIERQILNTDNWVAMMSPIPQTPVVATALSGYITAQIYNSGHVQQVVQNALPPKASFLAAPLTGQLQTLTNKVVNKIILSSAFQTLWVGANRTAMGNLLANARGQKPPLGGKINQLFNLNLSGIKDSIAKALGNTSLAIPALSSGKSLNISANLQQKREHVWSYIKKIDFLAAVLPLIFLVSLFGALALSHNRRKTLMILSLVILVLLLIQLISLKIGKQEVLDQVKNDGYKNAVSFIYDSLTTDLRKIIYSWLVIWAIILIICGLTGPARWAVNFRNWVTKNFRLLKNVFVLWHSIREWVRRYCYQIWLVIFIVFLVWLAFLASVSMRDIVNDILAAVLLFEVIYIIAFPRTKTGV